MPWSIPAPPAVKARADAALAAIFPGFRPDKPNSLAGTVHGAIAMAMYDAYLMQAYLAQELLPDTARDWLDRHASVWGVLRMPASVAVGTATVAGTTGRSVPGGAAFIDAAGASYVSAASAVPIVGGAATLTLTASVAGAAGNLVTGSVLTPVSPIGALTVQQAVVAAPGFAGGADAEPDDSLRARILQRIRTPPNGGAAADYVTWAEAAGATYVAVIPTASGPGTVGVSIAQSGPAASSPAQVAAVQTYIDGVRPVTASVTVSAATLLPVPVTLRLNPDTVANRAAAQAALAAWMVADTGIGATLYVSRLDAALAGDGEYSHERTLPAADVVPAATQIPVLGAVTFA